MGRKSEQRREWLRAATVEGTPFDDAACTRCGRISEDLYFRAGGELVCPGCRNTIVNNVNQSRRGERSLGRAALFGLLPAVAGSLVWMAGLHYARIDYSILAVSIGWGVGNAVHYGAGKVGGRKFQMLAAALILAAALASYVPTVLTVETAGASLVDRLLLIPVVMVSSNVVGPFAVVLGIVWACLLNVGKAAPKITGPFRKPAFSKKFDRG